MGRRHGAGGIVLVAAVAAGTAALAAPKCALPVEVTAIQTAAVQQQLMVAALTCNQVTNFNAFQTGFSKELRSSDRRLQSMFQRLYGFRKGTEEYHAFKTRLANDSSIRSINDNSGYCHEAQLVFAAALGPDKPTLANFVSGVAVHDDSPVDSCEMRVAVGLSGTKAALTVVPTPNPLRLAALTPPPAAAVAPEAPAAAGPGAEVSAPATDSAAAPAQVAGSAAPPAQTAAATASATQTGAPAVAKSDEKKSSGWLSGLFK